LPRRIDFLSIFKDPADRFILATAREYAVPLVSKDRKILDYPHVKGIW
jgi:PIN domain nuclease of toxin-antitoxin system